MGAGVGIGPAQSGGNGDKVQALVNAQNAAMSNPKFAPDTLAAGITHCNQGANNIATALGVKTEGILANSKGVALPANAQNRKSGKSTEWLSPSITSAGTTASDLWGGGVCNSV